MFAFDIHHSCSNCNYIDPADGHGSDKYRDELTSCIHMYRCNVHRGAAPPPMPINRSVL